MKAQTKTQAQILAAISCIPFLAFAYFNFDSVPFGYFSLGLCAASLLLAMFIPLIILDEFDNRKREAIKVAMDAIESGKVTNKRALNIVLDRVSKIYSLNRNTFKTF